MRLDAEATSGLSFIIFQRDQRSLSNRSVGTYRTSTSASHASMSTRLFLPVVAALLAGPIAVPAEPRGGINLCAAFHNVVPLIKDGEESCKCQGRAIECKFEGMCNPSNKTQCANLTMYLDYSDSGDESIVYDVTYGDDVGLPPTVVAMSMSPDFDEGILGCYAKVGSEDCECTTCGGGVGINCGESAVSTKGCAPVDMKTFDRFVPFFETDSTIVIAKQEADTTSGSVALAVTDVIGGATLLTAVAMLL